MTTAPGPHGPSPTGYEKVWELAEHPGFRRVMETASTVAAPLLAGFAFTLLVLILPTLGDETTVVRVEEGVLARQESDSFSRLPELAALLLLLAGLLLVMCVQAGLSARFHTHGPAELEEIYPEYFRTDPSFHPALAPPETEWSTPERPARRVGDKWYGGWVLGYFEAESKKARKWAAAARHLYHLGIVAFLAGVAVAVLPPADDANSWRWAITAVAAAGALAEVIWILTDSAVGNWVKTAVRK